MRLLYCLLMIAVLVGSAGSPRKTSADSKNLAFEGIVLDKSPAPSVSGFIVAYQLVKYRIDRIHEGKFEGTEIVVDHLIVSGQELANVQVGTRVCVSVRSSDKIEARWNAPGIREPSDKVSVFYLAQRISVRTNDAKE